MAYSNRNSVVMASLGMTRQCWEQGILAQAMMEMGEETILAIMVHDMVLRQSLDGRLCNIENTPAVTDSAFCIPATFLYGKSMGKEAYIKAVEKNIDFLLYEAERAEDGVLYHMRDTAEVWADSAAYLPYALALTGHPEEGVAQMKSIMKRLYDQDTGLFFHRWDDASKTFVNGVPWGIGNGWILTGLLRLGDALPAEFQTVKEELQSSMIDLLDRMLRCMSENGEFHDILNDPSTFAESETAAMVAYTIYRSVRENIIGKEYLPSADRIRTNLEKKVNPLGIVCGACSSPTFDREGTAVECQAHFMMMEQEKELLSEPEY